MKSRIHRADQIISSFEGLTQAITIKSKKRYPEKGESYNKSIYFDELCDFKLYKSYKNPTIELNQKPSNSNQSLGKAPLGSLEDVKTTQEIINDIDSYKDISKNIKFEYSANNTKNIFETSKTNLPDKAEKITSYFDFIDKKQIFGIMHSKNNQQSQSEFLGKSSNAKDSKLMKEFIKRKKQKVKKPEDEAPETMRLQQQLQRFNKEEEIIRRYTNAELQFNIPMQLNLSHIAQFETMNTPMEGYFDEKQEIHLAPQAQIYSDDADSYQTPIDMLKSHNIKQNNFNPSSNSYSSNTNSHAYYSNAVGNSNNSNSNVTPTQASNTQSNSTSSNYNSSNNNAKPVNAINSNINLNTINAIGNVNVNNQNLNSKQNVVPSLNYSNNNNIKKEPQPIKRNSVIPQAPPLKVSIPKPPALANPPAPQTNKTSSSIPPIPPIPASLLSSNNNNNPISNNNNSNKSANNKATIAKPNISNNTQEKYIDDQNTVIDKKQVEKINEGRGGLLDALKSDNPMARLKKSGSTLVKTLESKGIFYLLFIYLLLNFLFSDRSKLQYK